MIEDFYELIWNEFGYDVGMAEELHNKQRVETQHYDFDEFPTLHFPGFGMLRIVFIPEEDNGEETF